MNDLGIFFSQILIVAYNVVHCRCDIFVWNRSTAIRNELCSLHVVNIMPADNLTIYGAKASAAIVLI